LGCGISAWRAGLLRRFGFDVAAAGKFETPYPKAYFMALELDPGFLDGQKGTVIYPMPFLALE
jgi:predicted N-acetyltransferase YhbS